MSSTIATPSNMEPAAESTAPSDHSVSEPFKFVTHMKQYPLAVAAKNEVLKLPFMDTVLSTVGSASQTMRTAYGLGYIVNTSDVLADSLLNQIDILVPQLKTVDAEAVTSPITSPMVVVLTEAQLVAHAAHATMEEHITKPTVKLSNDFKVIVKTMIYNSDGKNRVLTPIDPIIVHINNRMEQLGLRIIPGLVKVPRESQSSELSRTVQIMQNMVHGKKEVEAASENN